MSFPPFLTRPLAAALLLVLAASACIPGTPTMTPTPTTTPSPIPPTPEPSPTALASLTLEQKAGQLFVIGFDGQAVTPELRRMVQETGVGGVVFFNRNVDSTAQVARMTAELQTLAREAGLPGLLVAVDQEGGRVARLTEMAGFTEFPGAMALAATGDTALARQVAAAMAQEMRAVGFNVDFAPDLDVNNNPDNPVIGIRSFGSDPAAAARFGAAVVEGLQSNGVIAFGKHFPGHGDTAVDSHVGLPLVPHDRARLEAVEFAPFRAAMQAGVEGIMSAHVTFPAIEPDGLPATLSPRVMTGLVRGELGFTGLLTTDSLEMGALADHGYPPAEAAARAFAAGADLLLFNHGYSMHRQAYQRVLDDLRSGAIPQARLDEAVGRILAVKERYGLLAPADQAAPPAATAQPAPADPFRAAGVDQAAHHALARQAARASITLVRAQPGLLPFPPDQELLVVETPSAHRLGELLGAAQVYPVGENPVDQDVEDILRLAGQGLPVILTTSDAKTNPAQARLVQAVADSGAPLVVIALRNPYDLMAFPGVQTYIAAYGSNPPALEALAGLLRGEYQPSGRLPVELPGLYPLGHGLTGFEE